MPDSWNGPKRIAPGQAAPIRTFLPKLEVLEDRCAPGALHGPDGSSIFAESVPSEDGSTTDAPAIESAVSTPHASGFDRAQLPLQSVPSPTGTQTSQQASALAPQTNLPVSQLAGVQTAADQELLTVRLAPNLFDPFAASFGTQAPVSSPSSAGGPAAHPALLGVGAGGSSGGGGSSASTPPRSAGPTPDGHSVSPGAPQSPITPPPSTGGAQAPLSGAQEAAWAINQTGIDLFLKLAQQNPGGNLSLSPYSLSTALAMAFAGARGETATQMAQVLNFLPAGSAIHADFGALIQTINAEGTSPQDQLTTADSLWIQQGMALQPAYASLLQNDYGSTPQTVDFAGATEQAREAINGWASQATHGIIQNLLPPASLDPSTRLVLANAIYLNANFAEPFDPMETREQSFTVAPGDTVQRETMHEIGWFGYTDGGDFSALSMDYVGGNQSMIILLPNQTDGLPGLEQQISASMLTDLVGQMQPRQVAVSLPSFQIQQSLNLGSELSALGMPLAFGAGADFSGINGTGDLHIGQVVQQVNVQVTETGTVAAAATGIGVETAGIALPIPAPAVFQADHPFVYVIRDNSTGAILFMGQVTNPVTPAPAAPTNSDPVGPVALPSPVNLQPAFDPPVPVQIVPAPNQT